MVISKLSGKRCPIGQRSKYRDSLKSVKNDLSRASAGVYMTFDPDSKKARTAVSALWMMAATSSAVCKLERDLKLAQLETTFWESCQAVRASSVALHKIHAFLMQELLELEADKRRALSQRMGEMEAEVTEMKVSPNQSI